MIGAWDKRGSLSTRYLGEGMQMFCFCAALSAAGILEPVIFSCVAAEWAGYRLHQLLGSDKLPLPIEAGWFISYYFSERRNQTSAY